MNKFFINKIKTLKKSIPNVVGNPLDNINKLMANRTCIFKLKAVHPDVIDDIISKLKKTKSCGVDNIDSFAIKLIKHEIVPVITHIVNLSITQNKFPTQWKIAKIIPLHKKDERTSPQNYRPVSLLPIFSKILERAVFTQIINYLEENNLLHPSYHGFRTKHNTSSALLQMIDTWLDALDEGNISAVVLLDLSAAFDIVSHSLLLEKLKVYGFNENSIKWIKNYLNNRYQKVYIDGAYSELLNVEDGVPQGSILGPLLYIIFTNDLPEVLHNHLSSNDTFYNIYYESCGGICCFADDSTYTKSDKDPMKIKVDIENKYQDISRYMAQNKLVLNTDKTHLLVMTTSQKHKKNQDYNITLNTGS